MHYARGREGLGPFSKLFGHNQDRGWDELRPTASACKFNARGRFSPRVLDMFESMTISISYVLSRTPAGGACCAPSLGPLHVLCGPDWEHLELQRQEVHHRGANLTSGASCFKHTTIKLMQTTASVWLVPCGHVCLVGSHGLSLTLYKDPDIKPGKILVI